jgi:Condensation domain
VNLSNWMESTFPHGNVDDYYTLSQEGMLLHGLREPKAGLFFQQQVLPLDNIDLGLFVEAWNQVVARHTILRTSFHWEGLEEPVQVVHRKVRIPVVEMNWSDVPRGERDRRLRTFLREDRSRGILLNEAPLVRITLIRWGAAECFMVKSQHHFCWTVGLGPCCLGK